MRQRSYLSGLPGIGGPQLHNLLHGFPKVRVIVAEPQDGGQASDGNHGHLLQAQRHPPTARTFFPVWDQQHGDGGRTKKAAQKA
ncbi:hypothetical protein kuro4_11830 [Gelria sp. Kuro-4]|nr:hypothetical protein kuro4_11830 [Gelria sp. Kuro-4]